MKNITQILVRSIFWGGLVVLILWALSIIETSPVPTLIAAAVLALIVLAQHRVHVTKGH